MKPKIDIEQLHADVSLIRDNHLVHLQDDVTTIKERMIVMETKMELAEVYLGKILKLLLPIALGAGILTEAIGRYTM